MNNYLTCAFVFFLLPILSFAQDNGNSQKIERVISEKGLIPDIPTSLDVPLSVDSLKAMAGEKLQEVEQMAKEKLARGQEALNQRLDATKDKLLGEAKKEALGAAEKLKGRIPLLNEVGDISQLNPKKFLSLEWWKEFFLPKLDVGLGAVANVGKDMESPDFYKAMGFAQNMGVGFGKGIFGLDAVFSMQRFDMNPAAIKEWAVVQGAGQINSIFASPFESYQINAGPKVSWKIFKKVEMRASLQPGLAIKSGGAALQDGELSLNQSKSMAFNLSGGLALDIPITQKVAISIQANSSNTFAPSQNMQNGEFQRKLDEYSDIRNTVGLTAGVRVKLHDDKPKSKKLGEDEFNLVYHKLLRKNEGIYLQVPTNYRFALEDSYVNPALANITLMNEISKESKTIDFQKHIEVVAPNRYILKLAELDAKVGDKYVLKFNYLQHTWYARIEVIQMPKI